ncbi:MAG: acyl-CoA synthetase [Gammaproteobacteria bacterium]|nr:acyl-CoA synthetase [Gammaproteobacteria bacterium]
METQKYPATYAARKPNAKAVIMAESGESMTWLELDQRSNQLAHYFYEQGLGRGDRIAVFLENNIHFFEIVWAVLRSGLYLTTVNRYLTAEEAGYIIDDCDAKVTISSAALADVAVDLPQYATRCSSWLMLGDAPGTYQPSESVFENTNTGPLPDEPAGWFMLYSSGTTGRPKGILRPLLDADVGTEGTFPILALMEGFWGFSEDTVYLSPAPLYHSAPLAFTAGTLALGGTIVVMQKWDPEAALSFIDQYKVTHSQWVPTMFSRMLKLPPEARTQFDLSSHRVAIHAAAPCPKAVKDTMLKWWGSIIYEYYGGTELNGLTHVGPEDWLTHPGTVGRAVLGTLHICDVDGQALPNGETGLVYFEQEQMPFSYHKDPDKTKDAQHPVHCNWSALGDIGYVDDEGFLYLTDRASFMIISGGVNIYPQEIEDVLVMHPKIGDVAVIGVPNADMGEEVKAVVELEPGIEASKDLEAELLSYARERLTHYKCPKSLDFTNALPRLPTGKLYKRILKDQYWGKSGSRVV